MTARELLFHPLANLFPLIEGAEFDELVADVRVHGVREPIWLYQGKVLDGRNRWLASQAASTDCPMRIYEGDDPVGLVVSLNLKRRHLDTSQRAMIAARLANMRQGERTDLPSFEGKSISQEQAANLLNVGLASVERAKIVHDSGDLALIKAVDAGDLSVSGAVERIRRGIVTGVGMHPYAERGLDLYETPAPATRALLEVESFRDGAIWECANGRGAISTVLRAAGYRVVATDIVDYGVPDARAGVDFLAQATAPDDVTTILTNPPFMYADEFVRHALALVPRVVLLLRLAFVASVGRADILDGGTLARIHVFANRLSFHRDGWDGPRASSAIEFAWFVWHRDHHGPIELRRISWTDDDATKAPPPGEGWAEMWARPFDYSKLAAAQPPREDAAKVPAPDDDWPELPACLRRTAP